MARLFSHLKTFFAAQDVMERQVKGWYVVFCKPDGDKIAAANLENQGIEVYRPTNNTCLDSRESRLESMFPRYLFIRFPNEEKINFIAVNSTRGVSNIVKFGGFMPTLTESTINLIRQQERATPFANAPNLENTKTNKATTIVRRRLLINSELSKISPQERVGLLCLHLQQLTRNQQVNQPTV